MERLGIWRGTPLKLTASLPVETDDQKYAVLLQEIGTGLVLSALHVIKSY
jgi:hypothetical protein